MATATPPVESARKRCCREGKVEGTTTSEGCAGGDQRADHRHPPLLCTTAPEDKGGASAGSDTRWAYPTVRTSPAVDPRRRVQLSHFATWTAAVLVIQLTLLSLTCVARSREVHTAPSPPLTRRWEGGKRAMPDGRAGTGEMWMARGVKLASSSYVPCFPNGWSLPRSCVGGGRGALPRGARCRTPSDKQSCKAAPSGQQAVLPPSPVSQQTPALCRARRRRKG